MTRRDATSMALLGIATLASGLAALIHQTVWTRAFAIILGSTVQATSATFAAFLVGLAVGAWIFGRMLPPVRWTIRAYVAVELAIAVLAPLVGLGIHNNADVLAGWIGGAFGARVVSSFTTVLVLSLLPTALMGATFPLVLVAGRRLGAPLASVGRLYGVNTLGAAAGALLSGFVLIRVFGVESTLWTAAAFNVASALCCVPLLRRELREEDEPGPALSATGSGAAISRSMLLGVAAGSGLLVLSMEIVWTRFAAYFMGNRTFAFTTLLACVLLLLAMGSWLSSRLYVRFETRARDLFGWALLTSLGASILSTLGAAWWIEHQLVLEPLLPGRSQLLIVYRFVQAFALLAPMLLALGCLFPLSLMCARRTGVSTGRAAGDFYLANTAGAVSGSLATGFLGVSAIGAYGCTMVAVFVTGALALWVFAGSFARERRRSQLSGLGATAVGLALTPLLLPNQLSLTEEGEEILFRREDEYGVMQVLRRPDGLLRVTNNRTELIYHLGLPLTSYVQQMQGHLGVFYRPEAKTALVLGSGYGITAGALAQHPGIERIDAVEIIPGMVESADLFEPYNYAYHRDPRVHVHVDDARHFLARSERRYDIISINVSDPHLPGGSALFHVEFYDVVKRHLEPDGVVIQHAFGSDRDIVIRTLLHSFEDVRLSRAYGNGWNAVAAERPLDASPRRADALLEALSVRRALERIGLFEPLGPGSVLRSAVTRAEIEPLLADGPIATDDHPVLEFAWSRDLSEVLNSNQ